MYYIDRFERFVVERFPKMQSTWSLGSCGRGHTPFSRTVFEELIIAMFRQFPFHVPKGTPHGIAIREKNRGMEKKGQVTPLTAGHSNDVTTIAGGRVQANRSAILSASQSEASMPVPGHNLQVDVHV
jgi:hypothetical protein